jgi:hypothetical protein
MMRLAVVVAALLLALALVSSALAADVPEHQVYEDATAFFTLPDGRTMTVGVGMARGEAVGSLSDHTAFVRPLTEVDFSFDQSLHTAHLSGTFNAVLCGPECVPAGVFILDITWKGVGTRRNQPMGQVRQYEDCSASLNHIITRDAVAFGTINGVQVEGTGTLYNHFYPPLGDCWGGSV